MNRPQAGSGLTSASLILLIALLGQALSLAKSPAERGFRGKERTPHYFDNDTQDLGHIGSRLKQEMQMDMKRPVRIPAICCWIFLLLPFGALAFDAPAPSSSNSTSASGASAAAPQPTLTPIPVSTAVFIMDGKDSQGQDVLHHVRIKGHIPKDVRRFLSEQMELAPKVPNKADPSTSSSAAPSAGRSSAADAAAPAAKDADLEVRATPRATPRALRGAGASSKPPVRAADDASSNPAALYRRAQALFGRQQMEEGRALLEQIFASWPNSVWAGESHIALGRQFESQGRFGDALQHLEHETIAEARAGRRAQALCSLGRIYAFYDQYDTARQAAQQAYSLTPDKHLRAEASKITERLALLGRPRPELPIDAQVTGAQNLASVLSAQAQRARSASAGQFLPPPPPGRVLWIEFYRPGCPYCRKAYPTQVRLAKEMLEQGVEVAWIATDPNKQEKEPLTAERVKKALAAEPRPGLVAVDREGKMSFRACHGLGTPWSVLVDRTGKVRYLDVFNEKELRDKVAQLLGEIATTPQPQ